MICGRRRMAQLVAGVVLDEQSRKMGLGLSKDRLASLTAEDPAFKDASGNFSRMNFDGVLRNVGMRAEDYLKSRERVAVRGCENLLDHRVRDHGRPSVGFFWIMAMRTAQTLSGRCPVERTGSAEQCGRLL